MNIHKLLAITLLTMTVISQTFQMPDQGGSNQLPRFSLGANQGILHQMHIDDQEEQPANESPLTTNGSPVGPAPVSPIFAMLQANNEARERENEGHIVFQQQRQAQLQGDQNINQFSQFNAAGIALMNNAQQGLHNSPDTRKSEQ